MEPFRLEIFSDGVFAIIITIMVLELKAPASADWAALNELIAPFFSYMLSFIYVGIYWNNHHHMVYTVERVSAVLLWANLHLLFWISLIPFATAWMGQNNFATAPTVVYGVALLMPAVAYKILQTAIIWTHGEHSMLAKAVGRDIKGIISPLLYLVAIALAFVKPEISFIIYVLVALIWIIPDQRIEKKMVEP